jgi:hypothetical protein
MKKSYLLLLFSFLFIPLSFSYGQLFVEDFNYAVGDSLTGHGWTKHSGTGFTIFVQNGSLTYTGYPSSGIGNHVMLESGSGSREDVNVGLDTLDNNGDVLYFSFLVNVVSANATAEYFTHIGNRVSPTSFTLFAARVFVQDVSGNLRFGISNTSTAAMGTTDFSYNTTYLVFVKYEINTGGADECRLWVFSSGVPLDEASAGTPEVLNSTTNGQDLINAIALRQGFNANTTLIDGIRVSTQWGDLVPVELTSFTSSVDGNDVILNWSTATELNNFGFEVQRSAAGNEFATIGFIEGYGTTTETKTYRFVDEDLLSGNYTYRLKQVDFNGTFAYSDEVNAEVTSPAQFELSQNYPNPFNPGTTIKFSIPQSANVSLKIFNTLGQEVSTLINQNMESGVHTINFDASELNSGIYFYRLDAGQFSEVKKMTLIK